MTSDNVVVSGLNVFPIKSCGGIRVEEIQLDSYGVVDDRRFMLIDGSSKRFVSQRKFPKLATVHAKFLKNERVLQVSAPGMQRDLTFAPSSSGERIEVGIWDDKVMVVDQGDESAQWFSEFIGHGASYIRLVSSAEAEGGFHRAVTNMPSGLKGRLPTMSIALADAGPVSIVSTESLGDVNTRMVDRGCASVPLSRFRMNIEISGCSEPFEEDKWLLLRIGSVPFLAHANAEVAIVTSVGFASNHLYQDTLYQDTQLYPIPDP